MRAHGLLLVAASSLLVAVSHVISAPAPPAPDMTGSWLRQGFTVGVPASAQASAPKGTYLGHPELETFEAVLER